jgi:hypothetical protein
MCIHTARRKVMLQKIGFTRKRQGFDHFPKYHMKILSGNFNGELGREDIFKPRIGNDSIHQDSNDNGVRIVNFATSKNIVR